MKNNKPVQFILVITLFILFVMFVSNRLSNLSNVITYNFDQDAIATLYEHSENLDTFITINADGSSIIKITKNGGSYSQSVTLTENDIRELKDVLNRYVIKNPSNIDKSNTNDIDSININIYANGEIYHFYNNVKENNFNYIVNFVVDLMKDKLQSTDDTFANSFL